MADFNLGARVSMDVDPIKASKTTLEKNLKEINKSLRNQRSEFKKNEMSVEQLANRQDDLGRAIRLQEGLLKKRQEDLEDMRQEMSKSNKVTDAQKLKLQSLARAEQQAQNQLNSYKRELKETELVHKQLNRSTDTVKNSLRDLKERAKLSEIAFKQSSRSVEDYEDHLTEMNYTIVKSRGNIDLLKKNLNEVSRAHGSSSREADKLRNDILKESVAMQIAQGRADELGDELEELQRKQRGVMLTATLMGAGWEGARGSMDRIATTLRSVGELTQGIVGGIMLTQFSNLVPILGSVVSLGAGLGGMLVSASGGAIALGGAFAIAGGAVKAFQGQATYALQMLEDGTLNVTNEVRTYQTALNSLKSSWEGLIAQNQAQIFNTMTNGINAAKFALGALNPFLTTTAGQIENTSSKMLDWVKNSNNVKQALNILNTQGPGIFQNLLNATMNFADGSVAMFNKLSPLYSWASQGFETMSLKFNQWANSVEGSQAINNFIEYTKTNLPVVGRIFGNVFGGLFNLFSAFSGHSHNVLLGIESVTEGFKNWSSELKNSNGFKEFIQYLETNGPKVWQLVKNITGVLWGLAKGMAPVSAVVLDLTVKFTGWLSQLMNTHPEIGKFIGGATAVGGALLLLAKPILMTYGALKSMRNALLIATGAEKLLGKEGAFATLAMKRQALQAKLTTVATKIWTATTKAAALATKGLGLAFRFMTGPVGLIITAVGLLVAGFIHLWKTNEGFRNGVISIWNNIKNFLMTAWKSISDFGKNTWKAIQYAIQNPMLVVKNAISVIFTSVKNFLLNVWNGIKAGVTITIKLWWAFMSAYFNMWRNVITTIFNGIKNFLVKTWSFIKNSVVNTVKFLVSMVRNYFKALYDNTRAIFTLLKNWIASAWRNIKNVVTNFARGLYNNVKTHFTNLYNSTKNIFNNLRNWLNNIWRNIKNSVTRYASQLWASVKRTFTNLYNGTRSIFSNVRKSMVNTWNAIKRSVTGIAASLWNSVKRTFNNMKNGLANIIGKIKGHITGMVNAVKKGLNKLIDGVNWVAGKIGMDPIPKLKLSTGTESTHTQNFVTNGKINRDTFATVGDKGRGNGPGGFRHEMIRYPNGKMVITPNKDTTAFLPKKSTVYNGAQTHAMLSSGTLPKFANGTISKVVNGIGDGAKHFGMKALDTAKNVASGAFKMIGDVFDYIENPGKLVDKVLSAAGVDFSFVKGDILGGMMKVMYKKLKDAVKNLFDGWLEEGGGADLSSFDKYQKTTPYSPNAPVPGYGFNGGRHYGIDYATPVGTVIKAPTSGTVSRMSDHGGGLVAKLLSGKFTQFFLHLSSILKTGKVRQGEAFAKTGNSGAWTTGPHLHYQVEKGNSPYITNRNTIDPEKFASMKGGKGGKQVPSAWRSTIVKAARRMLVSPTNAQINGIIAQIQRESGGDAGVTQSTAVWDINAQTGNLAQGLLQYVPSTFRNFAVRGHTNIKSGYDQLLAFFNNSNWANDIQYGRSGWGPRGSRRFAKGTNKAPKGLATVFEEGGEIINLRGGEQIIPNDVSIAAIESVINSDIFNRTQSAVYEAISRFAEEIRREKETKSTKDRYLIQKQQEEINLLKEQTDVLKTLVNQFSDLLIDTGIIKNKPTGITRDEYDREHNRAQDKRERRERKSNMYRGGALA
ncbi:peptidoglycan DD-metalloendopeptidase family protein [Staphylococcus felis]|uniref:peptidoglycan DD-metalloendopeptidase family protein n=1 Tax=Staphylococcus felis TaxID=46127 RepID=UPI000E2426C7|nr:peptidoglycan DD-metalloendopeptidase family protein [Staphylococcus felis]REI31450.1 hypothetical protein DOS80_05930 [Staphylococcus felis]